MTFDFLPQLPKPNLDDRKFNDLVEECLLRIPRYCPEWTNHNPSDPGVTLVELFAWLTDQMLFRFNQVPYRNYIVFLEMLGIRLEPPAPAYTELTFYLTKAQPVAVRIPYSTEVATLRTETEAAIVFSTDCEQVIGTPTIKHLLTADITDQQPTQLRDRTPSNQQWTTLEETLLFEQSTPGNCFYLVLDDPHQAIAGNVLALNLRGAAARTTGIDPDHPPRRWEAWNGNEWHPILRQETDDQTRGFSFSEFAQSGMRSLQDGADVILHLPQQFPECEFGDSSAAPYRGHWIRCVYTYPEELQPSYSCSPSLVGISVRAIGATVNASQCVRIERELLGISNGKAGQVFELQGKPVLERDPERQEYIEVVLPDGSRQRWTEVLDFADSTAEQPHYTIDSMTGTVQFGPLIREPAQLRQRTQQRLQHQPGGRAMWMGRTANPHSATTNGTHYDRNPTRNGQILTHTPTFPELENQVWERQYGKVPPLGAEIYMVAYRTGGGSIGNVQPETLTILKSAIPYVKSVTNYAAARGGVDAESLEDAVLRVPHLLRTRESAVTPEDFENVAKRASRAVARAHCLTSTSRATAGIVQLLIVPQADLTQTDWRRGMAPDRTFTLTPHLLNALHTYMSDRKPLGVQVTLQEPDYVGVSVRVEVLLDPLYAYPQAEDTIRYHLLTTLYRFLNPLTGGIDGSGWPLGRPLYLADIIALCQSQAIPGVRHLGLVELFEIRKHKQDWIRSPLPQPIIDPGALGLLCSWEDDDPELRSGHSVEFVIGH
jgi:predicted phage baseplate assembly protein